MLDTMYKGGVSGVTYCLVDETTSRETMASKII